MTTTQQDTIYNVRVTAYDLIEASSADEAIAIAKRRLGLAHFDAATDPKHEADAILETNLEIGTIYDRRGWRVKVTDAA